MCGDSPSLVCLNVGTGVPGLSLSVVSGPSLVIEYTCGMAGNEGRLYRTGDLSTDNLTTIGPAASEWAHDDDDWDPNDQHEASRVSVVKFREDEEPDNDKEVSLHLFVL